MLTKSNYLGQSLYIYSKKKKKKKKKKIKKEEKAKPKVCYLFKKYLYIFQKY